MGVPSILSIISPNLYSSKFNILSKGTASHINIFSSPLNKKAPGKGEVTALIKLYISNVL